MNRYVHLLIFLFIHFGTTCLLAQESLRGLSVNPELIKRSGVETPQPKLKSQTILNTTRSEVIAKAYNSSSLFADDFSTTKVYPDALLWKDSTVIINSKYSIGPPSIGVATFDALNKRRIPYCNTARNNVSADTLTSVPINLNYSTGKNIYLSFFYQPQGAGAVAPASGDSLILEFYNAAKSGSGAWENAWAVPGSNVHTFKEVLLKVGTLYLREGFRFRFRNIVSIEAADSNRLDKIDFWHVDNIRLDTARNANDSLNWCIAIPFEDDFSSVAGVPNSALWEDDLVQINSKYPCGPPTPGVATFDAIDNQGKVYDTAYFKPFLADELTSRAINLKYQAGDSIYLSFFYEPQGGATVAPSTGDSLRLEFYNPDLPDSIGWQWVWAVPGSKLQPFKEILIKVDAEFLKKGFRFRFRNIASADTADSKRKNKIDFWHIDNIRLAKGRNANDYLIWYINLPFVDDFSSGSIFPDQKLWSDKYAYINSTLPVNPPSVGVATLDAIDESGLIYSRATATPFIADYLTSKPINLALKDTADTTIFFSFYYQPQGLGDRPDVNDSLILEFYNTEVPDSIAWQRIGAWPGDTMHSFKQIIKQVGAEYQRNGFAFRFRNKASISSESDLPGRHGNADQWHIDYVRLDKGRTEKDTIIYDVAFVKPMTSLLQTYQAMPWEHFILAFRHEIKPNVSITFKNNSDTTLTVDPTFEVKDIYDGSMSSFSTGRDTISMGLVKTLLPELTNPFTSTATDSTIFEVKSYLNTDIRDFNKRNDTIKFLQVFNNYFALDDGSPETGYGLWGQGAQNAMVAYAFNAYMPDTLTAISIFFNPTEKNITTTEKYYFKLAVWADNKGKPGARLYGKSNDNYKPIKLNQFYPYKLDTALVVKDRFYVGWIQTNENFLNVGFDLNNNNQLKHFVNLDGTWKNTGVKGSLMIRPILRTQKVIVNNDPTIIADEHKIRIYPNPAEKYIIIETGDVFDTGNYVVTIFNISGKQVLQTSLRNNQLDVSNLPNGIYIVKISGAKTNIQPVKLLIQR